MDVFVHESGAPGVALSTAEQAVVAALHRWTSTSCSELSLRYRGTTQAAASGDGVNSIIWHTEGWASLGFPPGAAGATDILYAKNESGAWEIREADIHLNGFDLTWAPYTGDVASTQRSIEAVVTHEAGHLVGVLHVCEPDGLDGAPLCSADASFVDRTMYPLYLGAAQASLSGDDENAVCFLYPTTQCASCTSEEACVGGVCIATCGGDVCGMGESCMNETCVAACPDGGCEGDRSCTEANDCEDDESCYLGACVPRVLEQGDPCDVSAECATGLCVDDVCTRTCNLGCPKGYACTEGICTTSLGVFGDACESASACASGQCLVGTRGTRFCTRTCGAARRECPDGTACALIDGEQVCAPDGPSSCAARRVGAETSTSSSSSLVFLALTFCIRRLRRRREVRAS